HLWVFLSADYYLDVWGPVGEPPEEPEPFVPEPPPDDLPPSQRAAWYRAQQRAQQAAAMAHQQWAVAMAAYNQYLARIDTKNGYTASWWAPQNQRAAALLQTLGVTWRPRLANGVFAPPVVKLDGALVQAVKNKTLSPNYIEALLAARDLSVIRSETLQPAASPS